MIVIFYFHFFPPQIYGFFSILHMYYVVYLFLPIGIRLHKLEDYLAIVKYNNFSLI